MDTIKFNKNLLVIVHAYNSFVKDQIETMAPFFNNIYVLVRYKPIAEISRFFPISYLISHQRKYLIDDVVLPTNVHVIPIPVWYLPTDGEYMAAGERHYKAVLKYIENNNIKFDLVHAHFAWTAGYVGKKLKEKFNIPFILTSHGYDIYELPFKNSRWMGEIESVVNSADFNITVSNSMLKSLEKLNVSTPIQIISNGFKKELFYRMDPVECKKKLNLPLDKKIVLCVGSLSPEKGYNYLVDAIDKVVKEESNTLTLIIGDGISKSILGSRIKKLDLDEKIKLVGTVPHDDLVVWMNACDLFVLPSVSESFGVVQIEAMACGKPVIATVNGGSEYIVEDSRLGILVQSKDSNALSNGILKGLKKEWDSAFINAFVSKYEWSNIAPELLSIYSKVL